MGIKYFWKAILNFLNILGELGRFSMRFFTSLFDRPFEFKEIWRQTYNMGYKTLFLVSITIFIISLVITIQLTPRMEDLGAVAIVPNLLAVSLIREVGPVITALVCTGKIGSGIGAEIGSMKVTEQIDAMEVTRVNPYKYLVVSRVLAATIALPLLVSYAFAVGLAGSFIAYNMERSMSLTLFFQTAFTNMNVYDITPSVVKSVLFGFSIAIIASYYGFNTSRGANGVGKAANSAVVTTFFVIFFIDLIFAQITHMLTAKM
jgi:phospholipid/cholesterol/gamma-HCH transport system permease protein